MRRRLFIILAFASGVGLLASLLVFQVVKKLQFQSQQYQQDSEEIVVAAVNVGMAETLTPQHVKIARWPKRSIPSAAIRTVNEAQGRVVRSSIVAGEPLIEAKLAPNLAGRGGIMPMLVPEGQRGVTIKVDDAVKESGFIMPNSTVDVLVSMPRPDSKQDRISKIILQNVLILAAGQTVEMRDNKPVSVTTVTLALTPEQSERLAVAQSEGRLLLTTRNLRDKTIVETKGATPAGLLAGSGAPAPAVQTVKAALRPSPAPAAAVRVERHVVSVLRDGKVSDTVFVRDEHGWLERLGK
jgi:pilus assembly protein CpaB